MSGAPTARRIWIQCHCWTNPESAAWEVERWSGSQYAVCCPTAPALLEDPGEKWSLGSAQQFIRFMQGKKNWTIHMKWWTSECMNWINEWMNCLPGLLHFPQTLSWDKDYEMSGAVKRRYLVIRWIMVCNERMNKWLTEWLTDWMNE